MDNLQLTPFGKSPLQPDDTSGRAELNMSILEKVKLIDTLEAEEKNCLLKMIDIAIAKKKMKETCLH